MRKRLLIAILAAGASRRLGQPKQLVNVAGEPLLRRQCRVAVQAQIAPVTAILGCNAAICAAAIADLPVAIHLNERWEEGLASSIHRAINAATEENAVGVLILHGDQYRVTAHDLQTLHAAWAASSGLSACRSRHENWVGPPVILPSSCFAASLRLEGDEGARRVLSSLGPDALIDVTMPTAIYDLDLPAQLLEIERTTQS